MVTCVTFMGESGGAAVCFVSFPFAVGLRPRAVVDEAGFMIVDLAVVAFAGAALPLEFVLVDAALEFVDLPTISIGTFSLSCVASSSNVTFFRETVRFTGAFRLAVVLAVPRVARKTPVVLVIFSSGSNVGFPAIAAFASEAASTHFLARVDIEAVVVVAELSRCSLSSFLGRPRPRFAGTGCSISPSSSVEASSIAMSSTACLRTIAVRAVVLGAALEAAAILAEAVVIFVVVGSVLVVFLLDFGAAFETVLGFVVSATEALALRARVTRFGGDSSLVSGFRFRDAEVVAVVGMVFLDSQLLIPLQVI